MGELDENDAFSTERMPVTERRDSYANHVHVLDWKAIVETRPNLPPVNRSLNALTAALPVLPL